MDDGIGCDTGAKEVYTTSKKDLTFQKPNVKLIMAGILH